MVVLNLRDLYLRGKFEGRIVLIFISMCQIFCQKLNIDLDDTVSMRVFTFWFFIKNKKKLFLNIKLNVPFKVPWYI